MAPPVESSVEPSRLRRPASREARRRRPRTPIATPQVAAGAAGGVRRREKLDDDEFDPAGPARRSPPRTQPDLDCLLADLPSPPPGGTLAPAIGTAPGKYAIAFKGPIKRSGRWRVPGQYTAMVYKGSGWLDLRAAELTAPVTMLRTMAYKSRITILVPPGVRVEVTGFGIVQNSADTDPGYRLPADAPVVHVRAMAYKGTIEVSTRPPDRQVPSQTRTPLRLTPCRSDVTVPAAAPPPPAAAPGPLSRSF